jgi:hypothetical protein
MAAEDAPTSRERASRGLNVGRLQKRLSQGRVYVLPYNPPVAGPLDALLACSPMVMHGRVTLDRPRSSVLLV